MQHNTLQYLPQKAYRFNKPLKNHSYHPEIAATALESHLPLKNRSYGLRSESYHLKITATGFKVTATTLELELRGQES